MNIAFRCFWRIVCLSLVYRFALYAIYSISVPARQSDKSIIWSFVVYVLQMQRSMQWMQTTKIVLLSVSSSSSNSSQENTFLWRYFLSTRFFVPCITGSEHIHSLLLSWTTQSSCVVFHENPSELLSFLSPLKFREISFKNKGSRRNVQSEEKSCQKDKNSGIKERKKVFEKWRTKRITKWLG